MGIVINLHLLPHRIRPEEWERVYRESLKLVEAYDFMDRIEARCNGLCYFFACKTRDRTGFWKPEGHGWLSVGDLRTGEVTGEFMLVRDIHAYLPEKMVKDHGEEILLHALTGIKGIRKPQGCVNIWGGQTKGGDSHIYLLAVACLVVSRFPRAAMVSGDISVGQCRKAVRWANQYLTEPISLPVTGEMDKLLVRLRESSLSGEDLPEAFYQLADEAKGYQMGEFVRREFPPEELYGHYKKRLLPYRSGQRGFARIMNEYLEMGFSFRELCRLIVEDPEGVRAEPEEFLRQVLEAKLHIREKEVYDFSETARQRADQEEADREKELLARIFCLLTGMENRNVNAFYPLEKIREDAKEVFGDRCDVDSLIDGLAAEAERENAKMDSLQAVLYDSPDGLFRRTPHGKEEKDKSGGSSVQIREQAAEAEENGYEVGSYRKLAGFVPGCRMKPEFEEDLLKNFRQLHKYTEETFEEFRILKKEERENYLIQKADGLLLKEEVWERIFGRIMDDAYIERIYGVLNVNRQQEDGLLFCRSLFSNMEAIDHFWEKTKK